MTTWCWGPSVGLRSALVVLWVLGITPGATARCMYDPSSDASLQQAEVSCREETEKAGGEEKAPPELYQTWGFVVNELAMRGIPGADFQRAESLFRIAADRGNLAAAWNSIGVIRDRRGELEGALVAYRRADQAGGPKFYLSSVNLALTSGKMGRADDAVELYDKAFKRGWPHTLPNELASLTFLPFNYKSAADEKSWRERFLKGLWRIWKGRRDLAESGDLFRELTFRNAPGYYQLGYFGQNDAPAINLLSQLVAHASPSLRYVSPAIKEDREKDFGDRRKGGRKKRRGKGGRIRVGFISAFLREHASGRMIQGVIVNLPRTHFEVIAFSTRQPHQGQTPPSDTVAARIKESVDGFIDLPKLGLDHMRRAVEKEELDVLVFCELGMEPHNYLLAFSRLAPVQIATHGHASTSGITNSIDYYVSYRMFESPEAQRYYSEPLVALDGMVYYYPPSLPAYIATRSEIGGLPESGPLFVCVQTVYKMTPVFDSVWRRVLEGVPTAHLILKRPGPAEVETQLTARLRDSLGTVVDRVVLIGGLEDHKWFGLFKTATAMLDSYPFGGYTTSLEALYAGLPIVTLPHRMLAGNSTAGFLRRMGVPELVATDSDDYVRLAVRLGLDRAWRDEMSLRVKEKSKMLFEDDSGVQAWSRLLRDVVDGRKPALHGSEGDRQAALWHGKESLRNSLRDLTMEAGLSGYVGWEGGRVEPSDEEL